MEVTEGGVIRCMKAVFGAGVIRGPIKKKAFTEFNENYVAERDVKILIEKLFQRKERPLK